jgi:hypothetical protein
VSTQWRRVGDTKWIDGRPPIDIISAPYYETREKPEQQFRCEPDTSVQESSQLTMGEWIPPEDTVERKAEP